MAQLEDIPDDMGAYADTLVIPQGYSLVWTDLWGWFLQKDDKTASFRLTDRTYGDVEDRAYGTREDTSDIDYWTAGAISKAIEERIEARGRVRVLDVACGPLNKAAYQRV